MPIWASHPKLKEGELLSSWIVRIAAGGGMTAKEFCETALPIKKLKLSAIDRSPDDAILQALSEGTGNLIEKIRNASFLTEEGYLLRSEGKGVVSWIIPSVAVHTKIDRFTTGMAYCPECLSTDDAPYYRKLWHYAFYPICTIHRAPLSNSCPHCDHPYSYMQPVVRDKPNLNMPISACSLCGKNVGLRKSIPSGTAELLNQAMSIQNHILAGINKGAFNLPGYGYVYSAGYLDAMRCILNSLCVGNGASERMNSVAQIMGGDFAKYKVATTALKRNDFEHMSAEGRATLLCLANWMMEEWPARLYTYIEQSKINRTGLFSSIAKSYWLESTVFSNPSQAVDIRSQQEIEYATNLLRALAKRPVSGREVKEFMSNGSLGDRTAKQMAGRESILAWHRRFSIKWHKAREKAKKRAEDRAHQCEESRIFLEKIGLAASTR